MRQKKRAISITIPAILAGVGLLLLYLSALAPSGRWAVVAVAGLLTAAAVITVGLWGGLACYAVTGLLGLLLVPDRLNVLLYLLFFGIYPVIKSLLERICPQWLGFLGKLAFFNGVLTVFFFAFSALFLPALPEALTDRSWLLYLAGNVVFIVYDFGFTKLISFYGERLSKAVGEVRR